MSPARKGRADQSAHCAGSRDEDAFPANQPRHSHATATPLEMRPYFVQIYCNHIEDAQADKKRCRIWRFILPANRK